MRRAVVRALKTVIIVGLIEPSVLERLDDPRADATFDELALDSLSRLTLAACLDSDHGLPIAESDVAAAGSVRQLARLLAEHYPAPHE
jgi:acyl carrier protein